ncbi:hypothetical protein JRO89_XS07G0146300 [Xanthoceras sorbifolium]|uniref:Uncharacterized protein n=1 Tax=Xanthoceras sorbifolium TaxID=99658 RepID=A0ABQ8HTW8_9ROSI|nr:hypothetical protein JRO89_XS07G0146300 [Xanthoceras sorbifolium]
MAATMDFYSSRAVQPDPFCGELMEALEPFMKSASTTPSTSDSQTPSPSDNYISFSPSLSTQATHPGFYPEACSTSSTHFFSNGFSIQDPFLGLQQLPATATETATTITTKSLLELPFSKIHPNEASRNKGRKRSRTNLPRRNDAVRWKNCKKQRVQENVMGGGGGGSEVEGCVKVESSWSDGSAGSSPLSDLTFQDLTEPSWDVGTENFMLQKYPSYEIDWASILS